MFLSLNVVSAAKSASANKIARKTTMVKTPHKADELPPAKQNLVS